MNGTSHSAFADHAGECDSCASMRADLETIDRVMSRYEALGDAAVMSRRTLDVARPLLLRRAAAAFRRRVAVAVLLALAPLPLVLAWDAYLLQLLYWGVSALLPAAIATYLVCTYAALLLLLFSATYAAIPVLLARSAPTSEMAGS